MDIERMALTMAEFRGEVRAFREIFGQHTEQDMTQFQSLSSTVEKIDEKVDLLLLREAKREGEFTGLRRSAVIVAATISIVVSASGVAVAFVVG